MSKGPTTPLLYLFVCLSVCLPACLCVCVSVCRSYKSVNYKKKYLILHYVEVAEIFYLVFVFVFDYDFGDNCVR